MRPIRIEIAGFRSFRAAGESIEWKDEELVAIIGDTGSGKSSILEAMTFALFGQTSVTGQQLHDLINDDAERMAVTFRFWGSDGYTWEAGRETSRRGTDRDAGPQTAWLRKYGDHAEVVESVDGVRAVNERIIRLLGLDHRAFLRTMILPQGRFAALLANDDQRGRADTLRQIWRSTEVDDALEIVGAACKRATECSNRLNRERQRETDDPGAEQTRLSAVHNEAEQTRKKAATRAERVETLAREFERQTATGTRETEQAERLTEAHRKATADVENARRRREDCRAKADEAGLRANVLERQAGDSHTDATRVPAELAAVDRRLDAVDRLRDARLLLADREDGASIAADRAKGARTREQEAQQRYDTKAAASARTKEEKERAENTARVAATESAEARHQWEEQRHAWVEPLEQSRRALAKADETLQHAKRDQGTATHEVKVAEEEAAETEERLAKARTRSHARAAADGLAPGDDCTVCLQPLPASWTAPPEPTALTKTRKAAEHAAERRSAARERAGQTAATAAAAGGMHAEIEERIRRLENVRAKYGNRTPDEIQRHVTEEEGMKRRAEELASERQATAARAQRHEEEARRTVNDSGLERERAEAEERHTSAQTLEAIQNLKTAREAVTTKDLPGGGEPTLEEIDDATIRLTERRGELSQEQEQWTERKRMGDEAASLRAEETEHRTRAREAEARIEGALQTAAASTGTTDTKTGARSTQAPTDGLAALDTAASRAEQAAATAQAAAARLQKRLDAEAESMGTARGGNTVALQRTAEALVGRAAAVTDAAERAVRDFAKRRTTIGKLDRSVERATKLRERLSEAERALKPGGFPKWLTLRRSRTLLRQANTHLERMSRGRYAFVDPEETREQWMLHDERSGGLRQPASLSGGEQFLTALALSLGMVETVGRQGGRLESFFLDEGFGTLDAESLEDAVAALECAARPDHLVGVITHVREVAERMPHVLAVRNDPLEGTRTEWLDETGRARMSDDRSLTRVG